MRTSLPPREVTEESYAELYPQKEDLCFLIFPCCR